MTRTSARPPTGTGALTAKPSLLPAVTLPKRDARHLAPPKTMNMAVRHAPSPTPLSVIASSREHDSEKTKTIRGLLFRDDRYGGKNTRPRAPFDD